MGTADEANFVELLIANERVCAWLDELEKLDSNSKRYVGRVDYCLNKSILGIGVVFKPHPSISILIL
jgi:hypothetical protein